MISLVSPSIPVVLCLLYCSMKLIFFYSFYLSLDLCVFYIFSNLDRELAYILAHF